ncbi:MAG TPA: carbonate dehydratase [Methanotrichaceae archaeon]|nr:carbonate dehydratase [Methanotrichaceae archaeon]
MLKKNPKTSWNGEEKMPTVAPTAYVDDSATLIGDVRIGERTYIAPGVSLRADEATPIIIGDDCNVQDNSVFHGLLGSMIQIGNKVSIAHGAIVHGPCAMGDESFVGFNSVVHASTMGCKCFVGHGAVVIGIRLKDGKYVPHGAVIDSQNRADELGPVPEHLKDFNEDVVKVNNEFAKGYPSMTRSCGCR